jgi:hypothetical protein
MARDRAHSSSAITSLPERTTLMAAALSEFLIPGSYSGPEVPALGSCRQILSA